MNKTYFLELALIVGLTFSVDGFAAGDNGYTQLDNSLGGLHKLKDAADAAERACMAQPTAPVNMQASCLAACHKPIKDAADRADKRTNAAIGSDKVQQTMGMECPVLKSDAQALSEGSAFKTNACASKSQSARQSIADELGREARSCQKDVKNATCSPYGTAVDAQNKAGQGCKDIGDAAGRSSAARGSEASKMGQDAAKADANGMNMGDLAKAAGALAPLAAAAMQAAQGGQGDTGASSYPSAITDTPAAATEEKPEIQVSTLNASNGGQTTPGIGFGAPVSESTVSAAAKPGAATGSAAVTPSASPISRGLAALSNPFGAGANGNGAGGAVGSVGGGAGGANSSGASRAGDFARPAEGSKDANFERNMASARALMGLRPGKAELDDISTDATGTTDAKLADIGGMSTPNGVNGAAETALLGESLFTRIKIKYSTFKVGGRL